MSQTVLTTNSIQEINDVASFGQKLSNLTSIILQLTNNAQNSTDVERRLSVELRTLNGTLDNLQLLLQNNISRGITNLASQLNSINATRKQASDIMDNVYRTLWGSAYVLQEYVATGLNLSDSRRRSLELMLQNMTELFNKYQRMWLSSINNSQIVFLNAADVVNKSSEGLRVARQSIATLNVTSGRLQVLRGIVVELQRVSNSLRTNMTTLLSNVTSLLRSANQTLAEANMIDTNFSSSISQLNASTDFLNIRVNRLTFIVSTIRADHMNLRQIVNASIARTNALLVDVNNTANASLISFNEAKNADVTAKAVVSLASTVLNSAEEMQRIVSNFNATSAESQRLAVVSLRNTQEVGLLKFEPTLKNSFSIQFNESYFNVEFLVFCVAYV